MYKNGLTHEESLFILIKGISESIGNEFSPDSISVCYLQEDNSLKFLDIRQVDNILQKISESE